VGIFTAAALIAAVCAGALVSVVIKVAVKESRRIMRGPIQLEMTPEPQEQSRDQNSDRIRDGAALSPTHL